MIVGYSFGCAHHPSPFIPSYCIRHPPCWGRTHTSPASRTRLNAVNLLAQFITLHRIGSGSSRRSEISEFMMRNAMGGHHAQIYDTCVAKSAIAVGRFLRLR